MLVMDSASWQKVKSIFHESLDLSANERAAFLSNACNGDDALRREVEALLIADEKAGSFIVAPAVVAAGVIEKEATLTGKRIGHYEILEEIGRGGMGAVYLAVRSDDEYKKQVAIKLIKRGMDSDAILKRFRMERQILAGLEHPFIARLLDGGTTEDGLPYFVMEYVKGEPITKYCDNKNLNTNERLKLFRQVCSAIQYSHQNLVVHRDIKPSNIIVTEDGTPKLLDFGIAKLLTPNPSDGMTEPTASIQQMMTPEYASPEQIRGLSITTTTDVYSLGVVLYELLSGQRPFKTKSRSPQEIVQAILTEEPLRPSQHTEREMGRWGDGETAKQRDSETTKYNGRAKKKFFFSLSPRPPVPLSTLRGDIDNIVLKALRKEPIRRYSSVQEFSEDINRHLKGLPVTARADTFTYRAGKFVQRHKAGVVIALLFVVTLITATAITAWQARIAKRERDNAEHRFNQVRKLANAVVFDYQDQIEKLPGSTPVREKMIKDAIEYLDNLSAENLSDSTLKRELASAYEKIGDVQGNPYFANLGDTEGALASYRKALVIRESLNNENPSDRETKRELGSAYKNIGDIFWGKGENEDAMSNYKKALTIFEELITSDPTNLNYLSTLNSAQNGIGHVHEQTGDYKSALESYKKTLVNSENLLNQEPTNKIYRRDVAVAYLKVGDAQASLNDYQSSLESYKKSIEIFSVFATADKNDAVAIRELALAYTRIATAYSKVGQDEKAIEFHQKTIELQKQVATADPDNVQIKFDIATSYYNLGSFFNDINNINSAEENIRKAITIFSETLKTNPDYSQPHGSLAIAYQSLAEILTTRGDTNRALENYRNALAIFETKSIRASMPISLAYAYEDVGDIYSSKKVWKEAKDFYQKALDVWRDLDGQGKIHDDYKAVPDEVSKKIEKCDSALGK